MTSLLHPSSSEPIGPFSGLTRPSSADDAPPLAQILNAIIRAGGTTGYETPFSTEDFRDYFLIGPEVLAAHTVTDAGHEAIGFQTLLYHPDLPPNWADIATFTRRNDPVPGAGQALFAATCASAKALGLSHINATIRADNAGGLNFYRRLGFEPYGMTPEVPLRDGTPVDRLHHRYAL